MFYPEPTSQLRSQLINEILIKLEVIRDKEVESEVTTVQVSRCAIVIELKE